MSLLFVLLLVFAYLSGSIPFGKLAGMHRGIDIQKQGSGNIGFANTVRVLGWKAGVFVLVGDVAKGFIPVAIAMNFLDSRQVLVVSLAAIAGHIFPIWLGFKGGKGIATGLGVMAAINPVLAISGVVVYLISFVICKKSAPSSVIASCSLPIICVVVSPQLVLFCALLTCIALWTHRSNLKALLATA